VAGGSLVILMIHLAFAPWHIIAWHPLRTLNAINVRVLGADLLTVQVQLNTAQAGDSGGPSRPRPPSPRHQP
jgi:hypothetical protein